MTDKCDICGGSINENPALSVLNTVREIPEKMDSEGEFLGFCCDSCLKQGMVEVRYQLREKSND